MACHASEACKCPLKHASWESREASPVALTEMRFGFWPLSGGRLQIEAAHWWMPAFRRLRNRTGAEASSSTLQKCNHRASVLQWTTAYKVAGSVTRMMTAQKPSIGSCTCSSLLRFPPAI